MEKKWFLQLFFNFYFLLNSTDFCFLQDGFSSKSDRCHEFGSIFTRVQKRSRWQPKSVGQQILRTFAHGYQRSSKKYPGIVWGHPTRRLHISKSKFLFMWFKFRFCKLIFRFREKWKMSLQIRILNHIKMNFYSKICKRTQAYMEFEHTIMRFRIFENVNILAEISMRYFTKQQKTAIWILCVCVILDIIYPMGQIKSNGRLIEIDDTPRSRRRMVIHIFI